MEDTLTQFILVTQNEFVRITTSQNLLSEKHEESMRRMEGQMSNISQQITLLMQERESCDATKLINRTIPSFQKENTQKKIVEKCSEREEEPKSIPIDKEVSRENYEEGEAVDKFIAKDSPFRRTKNQIVNEPNPPLPDHIKPPYPLNKKKPKRELEVGKFKRFMEMLTTLQVNIPFCDALE